jgi:hypothetical protein
MVNIGKALGTAGGVEIAKTNCLVDGSISGALIMAVNSRFIILEAAYSISATWAFIVALICTNFMSNRTRQT